MVVIESKPSLIQTPLYLFNFTPKIHTLALQIFLHLPTFSNPHESTKNQNYCPNRNSNLNTYLILHKKPSQKVRKKKCPGRYLATPTHADCHGHAPYPALPFSLLENCHGHVVPLSTTMPPLSIVFMSMPIWHACASLFLFPFSSFHL